MNHGVIFFRELRRGAKGTRSVGIKCHRSVKDDHRHRMLVGRYLVSAPSSLRRAGPYYYDCIEYRLVVVLQQSTANLVCLFPPRRRLVQLHWQVCHGPGDVFFALWPLSPEALAGQGTKLTGSSWCRVVAACKVGRRRDWVGRCLCWVVGTLVLVQRRSTLCIFCPRHDCSVHGPVTAWSNARAPKPRWGGPPDPQARPPLSCYCLALAGCKRKIAKIVLLGGQPSKNPTRCRTK